MRTEPPGRSREERRTASATWSKVIRCRRNAISDTSIEISYGGALTMSTWVISGRAAKSSRTRSAIVFNVKTSVAPAMAMSMTWLRAISSRMIGFSVPTGNVVIASISFFTSSTIRRASAPSSSSTSTDALPSAANDRICLMPSMSLMASSIRTTTPASTSSGAAPRYGTWILIRSRSISGKTSSVTTVAATKPLAMIKSIMRLAATGLRASQPMIPPEGPGGAPVNPTSSRRGTRKRYL